MTTPPPPIEPVLAQVRLLLGEIKEAERDLDHARVAALCRKALNELNIITGGSARDTLQDAAFESLVRALERLTQYADALDAIALWQTRTTNPQSLISAHMTLGRILFRQGHFEQSLAVLDEVISRAEAEGFLQGMGQAYLMQANVLWTNGEADRALLVVRQALTIFQQLGDLLLQGQAHSTIAAVEHYMGQFYSAIQNNLRAIHFFETIGDRYRLALACNNLGETYQQLYAMEHALAYHQKAWEIFGEDSLETGLLRNLGVALVGVGRHDEGLALLNRALERVRSGQAEDDQRFQTLYSLAAIHLQLGNIPDARKLAEELLEGANQAHAIRHEIRAMLVLGHCACYVDDIENAHQYFHQGFMAAQRAADKSIIWQIHAALADLLADTRPEVASVHRRIAVQMVESIAATIEDQSLRQVFEHAPPVSALLSKTD